MNNKPEWLDAALDGHPVMLRDGSKAYVRHWEKEFESYYSLYGFSVNSDSSEIYTESWAYDGSYISDQSPNGSDIIGLWQEPAPVFEYWHLINERYSALAMDRNGCWYAYDSKNLSLGNSQWCTDNGECAIANGLLTEKAFPIVTDWKKSLILRPEGSIK